MTQIQVDTYHSQPCLATSLVGTSRLLLACSKARPTSIDIRPGMCGQKNVSLHGELTCLPAGKSIYCMFIDFFLLNTVDLWDIATYTKGSESHPKRLALQSKLQVQTLQSPLSVVFRVFVAYSQVFSMCFSWNQGQLKTHQFEFQVTCSEDSLGW